MVKSTWTIAKSGGCLGDLVGIYTSQLYYGGYFINHEIKISKSNNKDSMESMFICVAQMGFVGIPYRPISIGWNVHGEWWIWVLDLAATP